MMLTSAVSTPPVIAAEQIAPAEAVASMLRENGIDSSRISIEYLGGDRDAGASPESNRVAVCIVE